MIYPGSGPEPNFQVVPNPDPNLILGQVPGSLFTNLLVRATRYHSSKTSYAFLIYAQEISRNEISRYGMLSETIWSNDTGLSKKYGSGTIFPDTSPTWPKSSTSNRIWIQNTNCKHLYIVQHRTVRTLRYEMQINIRKKN
jgi:hypothetical protein